MKIFKLLKKLFVVLLLLISLTAIILYFTGHKYIFNAISNTYLKGHTTAQINDHEAFSYRIMDANKPKPWALHPNYQKVKQSDSLLKYHKKYKTAAYAVFKDGMLLHEYYGEDYGVKSHTNSFSMAKTVLTILSFMAVQDGYFQSMDDLVTKYIPEFSKDYYGKKATLADFSRMTSGYDWSEKYHSPLNPTTEAYYGNELEELILNRKFTNEPGKKFNYLSGNTQVLAIALKRALGNKTITQYAQEKLWNPLGMESNGFWAVDKLKGIEKAFCCIYSNARDFGKLGQLLLQNGVWEDQQLLFSSYVKQISQPNLSLKYGYSTWTDYQYNTNFYMFRGHLGQYIIVVPSENLVVVRLGEKRDRRVFQFKNPEKNGGIPLHPQDVYVYLEEALRLIKTTP